MKYIPVFILLFFCFSCTKKVYVSDEELEAKHFSFIKDSITTKEDIVFRFGEPTWIFENGRIYTYRLVIGEKDVSPKVVANNKVDPIISYSPADAMRQFSLILVFNNDRLKKHRLITIVQ
jgi:hypothetical protein